MVSVEVPAQMPGLEVTHKGQPIPEAHLCTFKLSNTGRTEIATSDFEGGPIFIAFKECPTHPGEPNHVLAFNLEGTEPDGLKTNISLTAEGTVAVQPMLWNSGDSMTIRVLLEHCLDREEVDVYARIRGVKSVLREGFPKNPIAILVLGGVVYAAGVLTVVYGYLTVGLGWMLVGVFAFVVGAIRRFQYREGMKRLALTEH